MYWFQQSHEIIQLAPKGRIKQCILDGSTVRAMVFSKIAQSILGPHHRRQHIILCPPSSLTRYDKGFETVIQPLLVLSPDEGRRVAFWHLRRMRLSSVLF
jgi:hypothetical protein